MLCAEGDGMKLENVGVLVTGASRGLGLELARVLVREGAQVLMVARGAVELEAALRVVRDDAATAACGGAAHALAFDVANKEAVHRIAGAAASLVSPIDVVIHAASTLGPLPMPLLLDTACEDFERVLAVNLVGPFRLTKVLAGPMVLRQRGLVVFVSSDAAGGADARLGAVRGPDGAAGHPPRF